MTSEKIARFTPYYFDEKLQDLPLVIFDEKYCKTYPCDFGVKNTARLTPYDFDEKLLDLPLVILMKITPCD